VLRRQRLPLPSASTKAAEGFRESKFLEISTTHFRRQMEMMVEQVREITGAAQKAQSKARARSQAASPTDSLR